MRSLNTLSIHETDAKSQKRSLLAHRVEIVKPSPTLAVSARADELQASGKPILNLSVGEADFPTPLHIQEAALKSIRDGHTRYTAVDGTKTLKAAIQQKFANENQLNYELNEILVSNGAKHSFYNLFAALLNPNDEVIIIAPYWVSYPDMVKLNDGKPVFVYTTFEQQFKVSPEQLEAAITDKTKILVLNSPSNPTGMAYSKEELTALANVLLRHPHVHIVSDDIYEHNLWRHRPFQNMLNVCPPLAERFIVINGVSKAYAMTGWRIGYAAGPAKIIAAMKKIQSQSTSNPCSIAQYAAEAALSGDQSCTQVMTSAYESRYQFVRQALQKIPGIECLESDGTFYTFPCIKALISNKGFKDDLEFAEYLLNEASIAVIPGSAFGTPNHMRLSFATSLENLEEAIKRLQQLFK